MQSLSTWPCRNESCLVPQLDSELGSFSLLSTKKFRRKRLILAAPFCNFSSGGLLHITSYCRSTCSRIRGRDWDLKDKLFCKNPKYLISRTNRGSLGASFALTWALEEQAVNNRKENSASLDRVSEGNDNGNCSPVRLEGEVKVLDLALSNNHVGAVKEDHDAKLEDASNQGKGIQKTRPVVDVRALGRSLHMARTADDVEEVLKDKGDLPLQVYCSLMRGFGKDKRPLCAMALFEWLRRRSQDTDGAIRPNLFIYNSLLGAIKQAEKYDLVEAVISEMGLEGINPNIVTYNTLMGIYIAQGREVEALNLFEEIPEKGLSLTPASYSTALLAYQGLEDGFGALKFLVEVKDKFRKGEIGKDVNADWGNELAKLENFTVRICHKLIRNWLVKSKNSNTSILKLLTEMDRAEVQVSRVEYERLVWACTHEEHYVVAKELYNRIRERDPGISLSVCNHVIWIMGKAKKWWAALEIYEDMLDKGPRPNNMSYELIASHFNILLTAAKRRGSWRWGVRLLNKMEEKGLKPGSKEWNAVLIACSKASETSAAVDIFKRMIEQGEKPTVVSYGALLSALEKGKLYDEALQVWKHMIKVGVAPNLYAYTIMATVYSAQGKFNIVNSIIKEMVAVGVQPTVVTFNAIISACGRENMVSAAYEWFQRMKDYNISPNEVTYEVLIEILANDGKPRLAYELYSRANKEGMSLSLKAYDAVIHSSQRHGATIDVCILGPRPLENKIKCVNQDTNLQDSVT
ncbi:OLC1v1011322C1 [Oldenlandia corymbosa var. corymbosa]|uniref:OLC1v1011322C1 n=1 Tax=Oldenlandia corymbosa var. corymbosa TaxID=529605 RepID=A0AAV1DTE4_OLDCO|nr:OLC1v1011322C1 [Oldenlandia corymbosa var. corymbosa]